MAGSGMGEWVPNDDSGKGSKSTGASPGEGVPVGLTVVCR